MYYIVSDFIIFDFPFFGT